MSAAERLSAVALSNFEQISPCTPMNEEAERCIAEFIERFGLRLGVARSVR